jgi:hypothetical protein
MSLGSFSIVTNVQIKKSIVCLAERIAGIRFGYSDNCFYLASSLFKLINEDVLGKNSSEVPCLIYGIKNSTDSMKTERFSQRYECLLNESTQAAF